MTRGVCRGWWYGGGMTRSVCRGWWCVPRAQLQLAHLAQRVRACQRQPQTRLCTDEKVAIEMLSLALQRNTNLFTWLLDDRKRSLHDGQNPKLSRRT